MQVIKHLECLFIKALGVDQREYPAERVVAWISSVFEETILFIFFVADAHMVRYPPERIHAV